MSGFFSRVLYNINLFHLTFCNGNWLELQNLKFLYRKPEICEKQRYCVRLIMRWIFILCSFWCQLLLCMMLSPICYAKWVWTHFTEANDTINIFTPKEQLLLDNLYNYIFNDAVKANIDIMTPWYGHAFRITDHLWREFTVTGGFPSYWASNRRSYFCCY